ncbi:MAG: hypothetical protein Q4B80_06000 [Aerococcaceae bacterium]|nr:hypothetical protein [Aerococcaceae bacterium]
MEIWILVVALLAISIVCFVLSMYAKNANVDEKLDEFSVQQSQELFALKTRIAELERNRRLEETTVAAPAETVDEAFSLDSVSDLTKEEVIRLYSQGYTMSEISTEMALSTQAIQLIIDDYIENR